ncbi:MAG: hypothetical protein KF760_02340 [Candidatus Eremiobacteraeota bacterium]|nr:hypothetical protein [Candidatus Eremiobacteraeota bacterium]MCW5868877.1 hypothetical protein [Candidatus Eremiobacteraeota bacterium]
MRRFLTATAILVTITAAQADVKVEDLLIRTDGGNANIRANIHNPGGITEKGPITVTLSARENGGQWQEIKTWTNIDKLGPNWRVARDYFDANNQVLRDLVAKGSFEVRAVVSAPGGSTDEKVSAWKPE